MPCFTTAYYEVQGHTAEQHSLLHHTATYYGIATSHCNILRDTRACHSIQQNNTSWYIILQHTNEYQDIHRHTTAQHIMLHQTTAYYELLGHTIDFYSTSCYITLHHTTETRVYQSILRHATIYSEHHIMLIQHKHGKLQYTSSQDIVLLHTTAYHSTLWNTVAYYNIPLCYTVACYFIVQQKNLLLNSPRYTLVPVVSSR